MKKLNWKNTILKVASVTIASTVISACDSDFSNKVGDTASYSSGSADFTKFVSLGDSLTAGYADSALYLSGQENSFPAVLAEQFALVGGGAFTQPLVSDNLGGLLFNSVPNPDFANRLVLDAEISSPGPIAGTPTTEVIGSGLNGTAFNNMGVPGAKSFHLSLAPGYGEAAGLAAGPPATANPYFVRFSTDIASNTRTLIEDVVAQIPTFYTLWIGNNDVLGYATSGGDDSDPITPTGTFDAAYGAIIAAIDAGSPDAKGVLVNIPDVSTIPYFTTVPFNAVPLDQATADALMAGLGGGGFDDYNFGIQSQIGVTITQEEADLRTISFAAGQNAVLISDEDLTDLSAGGLPSIRQANANDLLVLTTSSKIGTEDTGPTAVWGVSQPLEDSDVLIPSEIQAIETARLAFNATIQAAADADENLVFFDSAAVMAGIQASGYDYGTGSVASTYATGGAFSLDGVHPTARGYAIIANEIIDVINTGFGANIPPVDPGERTTIFLK
ncbi:MAG: G-D-S-L family lipolytic protein [endosymbiont of Galathealinum brachiosum]|uniref:G-D-S-L family lipolytic protein n=1 Tax=endosymbiont of Galathealinum brachiosum TaxID=2200906 RepID=A0A370DE24_9GAMM|nr:MAG: G-D-S-L family lipolytic protein [endosymbiont of Galathealinum brachiosum]